MAERDAETVPRCVICHGSGWTGSRHASGPYSEHYHCPCGAPCVVDRAEGCTGGVRRRTKAESRVCSQDDCHGDGRYQPPGKGHRDGCPHDPVAWVWEAIPDAVSRPAGGES